MWRFGTTIPYPTLNLSLELKRNLLRISKRSAGVNHEVQLYALRMELGVLWKYEIGYPVPSF